MQLNEAFTKKLATLLQRYAELGCPCSFPRFRALAGFQRPVINLEKEALLQLVRPLYTISDFYDHNIRSEYWQCTTCGSTFYCSFENLHLLPDRWMNSTSISPQFEQYNNIGAAAEPLIVLCCDSIPKVDLSPYARMADEDSFIAYMAQTN